MASAPVRAPPVFDAIEYSTRPFPVPDAPLVTVIHAALDVAVHAQVAADAVTLTEPVPPVSLTLCEPGAIEIVHGGGAGCAGWLTVKVRPAIFRLPVRAPP